MGGHAIKQVFDSFGGFDDFLVYFALAMVLLAAFIVIYERITPYSEFQLIREGNTAASFSLSGSIIGFVIPLAAAVKGSVSLVDMAIWGLIALIVQLVAFVVVKMIMPNITKDIPAGNSAQGFFLGSVSLAVGLLNAACMSY